MKTIWTFRTTTQYGKFYAEFQLSTTLTNVYCGYAKSEKITEEDVVKAISEAFQIANNKFKQDYGVNFYEVEHEFVEWDKVDDYYIVDESWCGREEWIATRDHENIFLIYVEDELKYKAFRVFKKIETLPETYKYIGIGKDEEKYYFNGSKIVVCDKMNYYIAYEIVQD